MSDINIKLLVLWYHKSKLFYKCHRESADYYDRWNKILGFPAILINVFNSTSLFANYQSITETFIIIIAAFSLFSTMLTAAQNYFEFAKLKDQHFKLMIEYSKILFSIEKIIILVKNNDQYTLDESTMNLILTNFEKLRETFIHFPEKIWESNNVHYKNKLEKIDVNTSDSINIILSTIKTKKDLSFLHESPKNSEIITYDNKTPIDNNNFPNNINLPISSDDDVNNITIEIKPDHSINPLNKSST
jgi:hypothetical protein